MELTYTKVGDYYIPDIKAPDAPKHPISKYGRMRKQYLAEHRPALYESLILNGTLWDHLSEIEKSCNERMEHLTSEMMKNEGVNESLKAADQMEWVRWMNNIRHRADETVLHELIYE